MPRTNHQVRTVLLMCGLLFPAAAGAQLSYPSFQVPQVTEREFNFALADARRTTSFVFQWREGVGVRSQLSFDVGLADIDGRDSDMLLLIGGQYAAQMTRATSQNPLDFLFTAGAFTQLGDGDRSALSIPFGVSLGHRFLLEGEMAVTPYVHPRISLDVFENDTELNINFDLGGSFEINRRIAVRVSASLGDAEAFGFSLAWHPLGLQR